MMNAKEKRVSIQQLFFNRDVGLRLLIGFIAFLSLFLFLHFREIRVEFLELNSTANHYIVGTTDFEFADDEATVIIRQQAGQDIGEIYQINVPDLKEARSDFSNYLLQESSWKEKNSKKSYEEVYRAMDAVENLLLNSRFTDAKTIQKIKELGFPITHYLVFTPPKGNRAIFLPPEYWNYLKESSYGDMIFYKKNHIEREMIDFVIQFFGKRQWSLSQDAGMEDNFRDVLQKTIPQKYSKVRSGTPIIEKGEIVTQRHLAMLQALQEALRDARHLWSFWTFFGNILLSFFLVTISALYLYSEQKKIFKSTQQLSLITCVMILTLAFGKITEFFLVRSPNTIFSSLHHPVLIPFAALLLTILIHPRVALYFSFFLSIIASVSLAFEHSSFLIMNAFTSVFVVQATQGLRKRKEVFVILSKCLMVTIPLVFAFAWGRDVFWNHNLFIDLVGTSSFFLVVALLCVGFLPILESLFNVMTDITLMEYMDPSSELLRRLTLEMPGTYQHSLVLGNLAEAAALSIGANGLFCRVATLYHDIGKLNNVHYFTENQQVGVNIHQLLTPVESAQVIISHVTDGEIIAKKYHLPQPFIDVILEHHGTMLVFYFYYKELELKGGDPKEVDESLFRYPGPKPRSKESAIIMIADAAEAASRSLDDLSEEGFSGMLDRVVKDRIDDGQFQQCPLTFEELELVKRSVIRNLMVTRHVRVKYPEREKI